MSSFIPKNGTHEVQGDLFFHNFTMKNKSA